MQVTDAFAATFAPAGSTAAAASPDIDRKDFLQLLVAQLQNQDPLNPLESAEFSAQLAQFSSLEQLMQINQGIQGLEGGGAASLDALGFLGREIRAASDTLEVAGGVASPLSFQLASAGSVEVELARDGVSLGSFSLGSLPAGVHDLDLSALDGAPPLGDGAYAVTVRATSADGTSQVVPTQAGGIVTGVDLNGGSPVLLIGDRRVELADVREVRSVGGSATATQETTPDAESEADDGSTA
jgi:flagellar basal-body rod modification protein FlgD